MSENEKNDRGEFIAGTNLTKGLDKANAAQKLRLYLMRRQGRSFEDAANTAAHELQHMSAAPKTKRVETGTHKNGRAFVRPIDTLTPTELYEVNIAVGEKNMSDIDKKNVRLAKLFMWLENLFNPRK
jgi:hypothetical protein